MTSGARPKLAARLEQLVGENIRNLRKARGLTRSRLAVLADVDERYLGSIERGDGNPTVAVVGRLARALKIHPRDLLTGDF